MALDIAKETWVAGSGVIKFIRKLIDAPIPAPIIPALSDFFILAFIRNNFDLLLKEKLGDWKNIIEAHPDQFTWGSDRWYTWHYDPEVGGLVEEFGRTFIGQLDPSVQEKFAYKNAERLLE